MCSHIDVVVKQEPEDHLDVTQQVKVEPPTEDSPGCPQSVSSSVIAIKQEIKDEVDVGPTVLQRIEPALKWSIENEESMLAETADNTINNTNKNCNNLFTTDPPIIKKERKEVLVKTEDREDFCENVVIVPCPGPPTTSIEHFTIVPAPTTGVDEYKTAQNNCNDQMPQSSCDSECELECDLNFTEKERLSICKEFSKLKLRQQNRLIKCLVSQVEIIYRKQTRRRRFCYKYFLPSPSGPKKVQVCKKYFVTTLGYTKGDAAFMRVLNPEVKRR